MNPGRPRLRNISFIATLPTDCFEWLEEECKRRDPHFNPRSLRHKPTRRISRILASEIRSAMLRRPLPVKPAPPSPPQLDPPQCHGNMADFGGSFYCFTCGREVLKARDWEFFQS